MNKKNLEKSSNNVELSHFDVSLSSLSFDHSKSNDQKNLNSFDIFSSSIYSEKQCLFEFDVNSARAVQR